MIDMGPLDGLDDYQKEFYLWSLSNLHNLIKYYNWKDWKDKKGKFGTHDEYIGFIEEKQLNSKGALE